MDLNTNIIDSAIDKKYTEFSDAIKIELKNKLSNHPEISKYVSEYDKLQYMKKLFAQISTTKSEE